MIEEDPVILSSPETVQVYMCVLASDYCVTQAVLFRALLIASVTCSALPMMMAGHSWNR